jgi:ribosomal protein L11 methyltransferase
MFRLFDTSDYDKTFIHSYFEEIYHDVATIVPQSVYQSDRARINVKGNEIAIDFIESLHESVVRYVFTIPEISAFGNGRHPTTFMCLGLLAETLHIRVKNNINTIAMLDAGTGTGILALCAASMGVKHIDAFDLSIQAYECAKKNIQGNDAINLYFCGVADWDMTKRYDCITANLMTDLILRSIPAFSLLLNEKGYCIVSGIIDERKFEVINTFVKYGCFIKDEQTSQGWFAGLFQKEVINP